MATVITPNNTYIATNNPFEAVWRLTRTMKKAGWTVTACSDGVTKNATASTDLWGNNSDPLLDTYPSSFSTAIPWIVMRGPSTIKIPINTAPTGSPLRGEKITQGAVEGELLGYVYDLASTSGWIVIAPRVGTFNTSSPINCVTSGASFTLSSSFTVSTYYREVMFSKSSTATDNNNGIIYYIVADKDTETAQLYSSLAASVGCTATVAPGAGSSTNAFPALGLAIRGSGGTMAASNSSFMGGFATGFIGSYHVACVNNIPSTGVSADGSFYVVGSNSGNSTNMPGFMFCKVDDTDPGDPDPYVFVSTCGIGFTVFNKTVNTSYNSSSSFSFAGLFNSSYPMFFGYQARGCPVTARDVPCAYAGLLASNTSLGGAPSIANYPQPIRTLNHPATTPPLTRENVLIYTPGTTTNYTTIKHFKGRLRWMSILSLGNILDTFDSKKFICVSASSSSYGSIIIGPWDGFTTPSP